MHPYHFFLLISFHINRCPGNLCDLYNKWDREIFLRLGNWARENNFRMFPSAWGADPPLMILDSRHESNQSLTGWYDLFQKHARKSCRFRSNFTWLKGRGFSGNCLEILHHHETQEYHHMLTSLPGITSFFEYLNRFNTTYEDDLVINFTMELYVLKKATPIRQKSGLPHVAMSA